MSTDEQGHNGWKNYETWLIFSTLTNERDSYDVFCHIATAGDATLYERHIALRKYVEEKYSLPYDGMAGSIVNAALDDVDWRAMLEFHISELESE